MSSPDVPGGVVSQTTKETDTSGHLVRRSTLKLVSYGIRPEVDFTGLFGRKLSAAGAEETASSHGNRPK